MPCERQVHKSFDMQISRLFEAEYPNALLIEICVKTRKNLKRSPGDIQQQKHKPVISLAGSEILLGDYPHVKEDSWPAKGTRRMYRTEEGIFHAWQDQQGTKH